MNSRSDFGRYCAFWSIAHQVLRTLVSIESMETVPFCSVNTAILLASYGRRRDTGVKFFSRKLSTSKTYENVMFFHFTKRWLGSSTVLRWVLRGFFVGFFDRCVFGCFHLKYCRYKQESTIDGGHFVGSMQFKPGRYGRRQKFTLLSVHFKP